MKNIFVTVQSIIADVLDREPEGITPETYVMRDLPTESIDLLEYGVALNAAFGIHVQDTKVFLKEFRSLWEMAKENGKPCSFMRDRYPHIEEQRMQQMVTELDAGPVLQVRDIVAYVEWMQRS